MHSIERHLVGWVLGASSLGALLLGGAAYFVTRDDLNEALDENLQQVALALAAQAPRDEGAASATAPSDDAKQLMILRWTPEGRRRFASDPLTPLAFSRRTGLARQSLVGIDWDVYTLVVTGGVIQVAQRVAAQEQEAAEAVAKLFLPFAALIGVAGALLVFALRRGLAPLDAAAADVAARSAASLAPIADQAMPRELRPLVHAMNELMQRLSLAFATQRRFVADAAHELRTPVTALRLQLQILEAAPDTAAREDAIAELRAGIHRSQHLIEQLLNLSRSEPDALVQRSEAVSLSELARAVVGALCVKADHGRIDLGAEAHADIRVQGDPEQLTVLLNNLVENALRYTPPGGVVDVVTGRLQGQAVLRVIDNGPGVPEAEREEVFDRFRRGEAAQAGSADGLGSGLGLAIVKAIAQRHGASVALLTAPGGSGLEVRVVFGPGSGGDAPGLTP